MRKSRSIPTVRAAPAGGKSGEAAAEYRVVAVFDGGNEGTSKQGQQAESTNMKSAKTFTFAAALIALVSGIGAAEAALFLSNLKVRTGPGP